MSRTRSPAFVTGSSPLLGRRRIRYSGAMADLRDVDRADERDSLLVDVELPASGECHDAACNRSSVCGEGSQGPDYLHARRTIGGKAMNDPIVDEVRRVR